MPFPPNYHGFDESLLEGLRFNATLQLRTPLEVLLHHGEMFIGSIEDAPKYGFWNGSYSPHGIWLPETKALGQLAIEQGGNIELATKLDELNQEHSHASDIGYALPSEYLPFLIEFRKIVESDLSVPEQLQQIRLLAEISKSFRSISGQLADHYPGFPESFFMYQLSSLPGVGRITSARLFQAGYYSINALLSADINDLVSIHGIGRGTANKILASLKANRQ